MATSKEKSVSKTVSTVKITASFTVAAAER